MISHVLEGELRNRVVSGGFLGHFVGRFESSSFDPEGRGSFFRRWDADREKTRLGSDNKIFGRSEVPGPAPLTGNEKEGNDLLSSVAPHWHGGNEDQVPFPWFNSKVGLTHGHLAKQYVFAIDYLHMLLYINPMIITVVIIDIGL